MEIEKIGTNNYVIQKHSDMRCDVSLYLSPPLLDLVQEDDSLKQLCDAASMQGVAAVIGMPDLHQGFGIPIGGVMVMDADRGLISAGAVGMDINCGVRLLKTELQEEDLAVEERNQLMRTIAGQIPTGIGTTSPLQSTLKSHLKKIAENGVEYLTRLGLASETELSNIQDRGNYPGASVAPLSERARERMHQLGTLGGGNHFIELNRVAEIYDKESAQNFDLKTGQLVIQVHSGSRGFGHQICKDFSSKMQQEANKLGVKLPSKGLAAAPIESQCGREYRQAMAAAANFAYANRQVMTEIIRRSFEDRADLTGGGRLEILYDISHNLARFEEIDGRRYLVHRKGAVRALPGDHPECPEIFKETGHPVLVPGNMGSNSYVLTAGKNVKNLCYSVNHGAGRVMSRTAAKKKFDRNSLNERMGSIPIYGARPNQVLDEAPGAYKNIDTVVDTLADIGVTHRVARLEPLAVIKGD